MRNNLMQRPHWTTISLNLHQIHDVALFEHHLLLPRYHHIEAETNDRHFPDIFKFIFLYENIVISIKISLKLVTKDQINKIPGLV